MTEPDEDYGYDDFWLDRRPVANLRDNYAARTHALRAEIDAREAAEEAAHEARRAWWRARRHRARPEYPGDEHCICLLAVQDHDRVLAAELRGARNG